MKICISSSSREKDGLVDPRFGRCPYFVFYDTDSRTYTACENRGVTASGGAGIAAAQTVIDMGAEAVLTGSVGPNAMEVLKSGDIKIAQAVEKTVEEAVKAYEASGGKEINEPVSAHYGMGNRSRGGW